MDVFKNEIFPAEITFSEGMIVRVEKSNRAYSNYILPGLIDSHVHIESSMLTPAGFAELAVKHGTVAVVSDPHEIANIVGLRGVDFMIENGATVPLKFFFGAPSCVPATDFECSGARIDVPDIEKLVKRDDIYFLSEVMNFPGVISGERSLMRKIALARKYNKPVDGHAPGLTGDDLIKYIAAGIKTDHECISLSEAEEKISLGMKIQIREGSAAKGFEKFHQLINKYPGSVMLCSDDLHPNDLLNGHINALLSKGVKMGIGIFNLIRAASLNPALHYRLPVGMLREGDHADMVIVEDLDNFHVIRTVINGRDAFRENSLSFKKQFKGLDSKFRTESVREEDIKLISKGRKIKVIEVNDGDLYTGSRVFRTKIENGYAISDVSRDICKIVVVNKYFNAKPAVGFITGFGIKKGAIAGSIAHDSHNIIAVGTDDYDIINAINSIIELKGGLAVVNGNQKNTMQLEIGGIMTNMDGGEVARRYLEVDNCVKKLGSPLTAPFMSLSFMALLVIPELKIGDKGLFDANRFSFTSLFIN